MSQPATPTVTAPDQEPSNISAVPHASQQPIQQPQSSTPTSATSPAADMAKDVVMSDRTPDRPASPAMAPGTANAPSPVPARTGTPSRTNGNEGTSRATSQHPDPAPAIPKEAPPHGAPTRQYLNSKVTTVLLEGMKQLAKEQPKDPLRVLGEYLLQRSKELEGN